MGLGKTVQTIALLAHLREKQGEENMAPSFSKTRGLERFNDSALLVYGPILIVVPLSTVSNWIVSCF